LAPEYDLVLEGGRVIDPETGLDAPLHVGIADGKIAALSEAPLSGQRVLDVRGHVVAPGFIDLHTHSPTRLGEEYQLQDGVTTALELEAGAFPVNQYGERFAEGARMNYGASVGYLSIRTEVKLGVRQAHIVTSGGEPLGWLGYWTIARSLFSMRTTEVFSEEASPAEIAEMRQKLQNGIQSGGLGVGLPLDYFSEAANDAELEMIFEVAAESKVPVFMHVRRGVNGDPAGLLEALDLAERTGASLHVCHITHNAMRSTEQFLEAIRAARARGVDVTTEVLPYNAGSALISSAVFGRNWQEIFAIDYEDVEWAATGERFNEAMWNEYREKYPDGQVIHHYLKDEWTRRGLAEPGVIVVSDLLPMESLDSKVAPHNGAFSRVLGRYSREAGLLDLPTALSKMTWLPAKRLENFAPAFAKKGRIQLGADADITVFDPERIIDRATYKNPYQTPEGILYVIVAGEPVVVRGELVEDAYPGQRLTTKTAGP
jgi:N-acyl-D-aspartate/D-glutamate deacylase